MLRTFVGISHLRDWSLSSDSRPDMTSAVDWAFKANSLSIFLVWQGLTLKAAHFRLQAFLILHPSRRWNALLFHLFLLVISISYIKYKYETLSFWWCLWYDVYPAETQPAYLHVFCYHLLFFVCVPLTSVDITIRFCWNSACVGSPPWIACPLSCLTSCWDRFTEVVIVWSAVFDWIGLDYGLILLKSCTAKTVRLYAALHTQTCPFLPTYDRFSTCACLLLLHSCRYNIGIAEWNSLACVCVCVCVCVW